MNKIMEKYLGVKLIKASTEMSRKEYCDYRGWDLPEDENGEDRVYLVEYEKDENSKQNHPDHKGYISMSPKDVFEKAYRKINGLTFGLAIEALKQGKLIARKGWNGKNMFLFIRPSDELPIGFIVNKVKSLPERLKRYYFNRGDDDVPVKFGEYICMKAVDDSIVNGWLASQTDMLAEDWFILE